MKVHFLTLLMTSTMVVAAATLDLPNAIIAGVRASPEAASAETVSSSPTTLALPVFAWNETSFNFGKVAHNAPVTHEFRFVNKGSEPLIITSVKASCGCTVAKYTQDPIPAGGEGFVTATYNAATMGIFNKTITVNANTQDGVVVLAIRGEVQ